MSIANPFVGGTFAVFPQNTLPGWGWSVTKAPEFKSREQKSVSGRVLKIIDQPNPIWHWTLTFPLLRDGYDTRGGSVPGLANFTQFKNEFRTLAGFYANMQGAFGLFYFDDPTDDIVAAQSIATANGSSPSFQMTRFFGLPGRGISETITDPNAITAIYYNGISQALTNFAFGTVNNPGLITDSRGNITNGTVITADFSYFWRCRFEDDTLDFENFLYQAWTAKEIKLKSVLP